MMDRAYEYVGSGYRAGQKAEPGSWLHQILKGGGYIAKDGSVYRKR